MYQEGGFGKDGETDHSCCAKIRPCFSLRPACRPAFGRLAFFLLVKADWGGLAIGASSSLSGFWLSGALPLG